MHNLTISALPQSADNFTLLLTAQSNTAQSNTAQSNIAYFAKIGIHFYECFGWEIMVYLTESGQAPSEFTAVWKSGFGGG